MNDKLKKFGTKVCGSFRALGTILRGAIAENRKHCQDTDNQEEIQKLRRRNASPKTFGHCTNPLGVLSPNTCLLLPFKN